MVLGFSLVVAAGFARAGWDHHSGSSDRGDSMSSESSTPAPEETTGSYGEPGERSPETSVYRAEEPLETGRMPESRKSDPGEIVVYESGGQLYRHGIDDGP
jgi:hypothetical protein